MKVLFYTTFLTQGGGIEVATINYLKEFIKKGYQIDLYVDYNMGKENIREKEVMNISSNINIKYLKSEKLSKIIYKLRTLGKKNKIYNLPMYFLIILSDYLIWKREIKIVEKNNYDATITFFQFLPSYITKIKGPKHSIFLHGSINEFFKGIRKFFKKQYLKKLKTFNNICLVSEGMKKELDLFFPSLKYKRIIMYNPIDFKKIEKDSLKIEDLDVDEKNLLESDYICSVGRIDEIDKDFETLIKAYAILTKECNLKEKLIIIGDGLDKIKLENMVKKLNLNQKILFLGKKSNPYTWMKNSQLFILSSKFEGFGLVLLEALYLGKKVISSNCPVGPSDILENGKLGSLFEVGNIEELANCIIDALNNKNKEIDKSYLENKYKTDVEKLF